MATFKIGQRVRFVGRVYHGPGKSPQGREGVVVVIGGQTRAGTTYEYLVKEVPYNGLIVFCDSHELEPLQPEGWQKVEWQDCLWSPDRLREVV